MSDLERAKLAAEAQAVFNNPAFNEAVNEVKEYHMSIFKRPNATDVEVLEAHRDMAALTRVVEKLRKFGNTEKLAKHREEKHRG